MKKWIPLSAITVCFFWLTGINSVPANASPQCAAMADMSAKYPDYAKQGGKPDQRQVALTFDDGPDTVYTPKILDELKENHAKATFFLIGSRAEAHPDIVKRIVNEGSDVANHTYDHRRLTDIPFDQFQKEVLDTGKILKQITGHKPQFFRPPYTCIAEEQVKWLVDQKIYTIFWNVDTQDWMEQPADQVEAHVFNQIRPGAIIVMHSTVGNTAEALPRIIKRLRDQGFEPVSVSQLLGVSAYADENQSGPNSNESANANTSSKVISERVADNVYGKPQPPKSAIELDSTDYSLVVKENMDTSVFNSVYGSKRNDVTKYSTFSTADPTIVTVDPTGTMTGLKRGETVLTATYKDMKTTAKITVY
ncbi:polysaccharide deacetylase family protein [Paenibacillus filicis]|uniref:Polysaccharide deacetylase family protein n=1 Tax=Paenibacillus gyeongsangnamensis TaxID=3388067 RepID=A0ABT4Q8K6_9BACL|nr:polysaccharide deacetylase family protein [Paenibacillus filicis]MCZ8513207.1 polysaccharide deacetylase family protein [Paenibacillus filicis]